MAEPIFTTLDVLEEAVMGSKVRDTQNTYHTTSPTLTRWQLSALVSGWTNSFPFRVTWVGGPIKWLEIIPLRASKFDTTVSHSPWRLTLCQALYTISQSICLNSWDTLQYPVYCRPEQFLQSRDCSRIFLQQEINTDSSSLMGFWVLL